MMFVTLVALIVLFVVPILFVWNEVYQDGLVGRFALVTISLSAIIFGFKIASRDVSYLWPETQLMIIAFAIFLCWHLWRFHSRVLTSKKAKEGMIERRMHRNGA